MIDGSESTAALLDQAEKLLGTLRQLMRSRRQRDKACRTLTDLHVAIEHVARRLNGMEFSEAPVARDDDEDHGFEQADSVSMADLLFPEASAEEIDVADDQGMTVEEFRLAHYRAFMDFHYSGCETVEDVAKRIGAFVRRVRPDACRKFGISQAAQSRRFGEQRATTSAREKRVVEAPLIASGAKGFHGLGGVRSETHRRRCAKAQENNTNRRTGEARRRATD